MKHKKIEAQDSAKLLHSSKHFCIMPWTHIHILPSSKVLPCCIWPYDKPIGDVSQQSLQEIWNSDSYKELRLNMLADKPSAGCKRCYEVEESGSGSVRRMLNTDYVDYFDKFVPLTNQDGSHDKLNLTHFDVRFSNICNFKCRGCSPELSSAWHSDFEKMYGSTGPKYITVSPNENLWDELNSLIDTIEVAYFAGGEPLIMDDHYRMLEEFISRKKFVELAYNTNLSKISYRGKSICDYWNHFDRVRVGISIDDVGKRGEYFRHGMDWTQTLENIRYIKQHSPHVNFTVNCTVNAMNVLYIPEIHATLVNEGVIRPNKFQENLLFDPDFLRAQILPRPLKRMAAANIYSYMESCKKNPDWSEVEIFQNNQRMLTILRHMDQQDLTHLLPAFIERTRKLDELRNESFKDVFPELAAYISLD